MQNRQIVSKRMAYCPHKIQINPCTKEGFCYNSEINKINIAATLQLFDSHTYLSFSCTFFFYLFVANWDKAFSIFCCIRVLKKVSSKSVWSISCYADTFVRVVFEDSLL